jgi:hypothetical protein
MFPIAIISFGVSYLSSSLTVGSFLIFTGTIYLIDEIVSTMK